jgi:hypothetical protein
VVATQPFAVEVGGREIIVHEGDVFEANDPVVKGRGHLFEAVNPTPRVKARGRGRGVEQATVAPGEKRRR